MKGRASISRRAAAAALLLWLGGGGPVTGDDVAPAKGPSRERELRRLHEEIGQIESELRGLQGREQGLVGELRRLDAELRLRQKEHDELTLRRSGVDAEIAQHDERIDELQHDQDLHRRYLEFRLREIYKTGAHEELRRLVEGGSSSDYWKGVRYASLLSERDQARIAAYRVDRLRIEDERGELGRARGDLTALEKEVAAARLELAAARRRHAATLGRVRQDQELRRTALGELETAAGELEQVIAGLSPGSGIAPLDMRKFKGLLDWPADASVKAAFGTVVHPQFKTEVPHPGWDLAAEFGADIRSVFDGSVVFADWMRGYGLTVIVDHSGGMMSIYAHASVLLVGDGERVLRGQLLGKVGETASLRGPVLYFELRDGGRPVDPRDWLRRK